MSQRILSLDSNDFFAGISPYPYYNKYGLFRTAQAMNPFSAVGLINTSKSPVVLGGGVVVDSIKAFAPVGDDLYGYGGSGNFYKAATFYTGTPTVTNLRSGSLITNTAVGFEVFQTKVGAANKIYYWRGLTGSSGYIGQTDGGVVWNDALLEISPTYGSNVYPTLRIDDEVYFGSKWVVSRIYDDQASANPALQENVLDLPFGYTIVGLETDGTYLIIAAIPTVTNSTTSSDNNETRIYYWDYKSKPVSWTLSYTIKDTINDLKFQNGVCYAIGTAGLWAFTSATAPSKVRTDIKNSGNGFYNSLVKYNDGLLAICTSDIRTYGKILPSLPNSVFSPFSVTATAMILPYNSSGSNRLFYSKSNTLEYQDILAVPGASGNQDLSIISSLIDLQGEYNIDRVEIILAEALASGQGIDNVYLDASFSGGTDGVDQVQFNPVDFTAMGAIKRCKLYAKNASGNLTADQLRFRLSQSGSTLGTNGIKRIDVYGEKTTNN